MVWTDFGPFSCLSWLEWTSSWLPQECRGDLQPFRSHSLAGSRQIFYCISTAQIHFIGLFLEISGIWSKDFWGQDCTFWGIENAKIPSFGFRTRFNPFLRDLVLSSCCMIRGAARMRKCWFYPKMIVVRWRMIVGHDDWPEFQAAEWWRSVCAVMTENDPCVWYCKGLGDAFIDGNILISVKPAKLKAWKNFFHQIKWQFVLLEQIICDWLSYGSIWRLTASCDAYDDCMRGMFPFWCDACNEAKTIWWQHVMCAMTAWDVCFHKHPRAKAGRGPGVVWW